MIPETVDDSASTPKAEGQMSDSLFKKIQSEMYLDTGAAKRTATSVAITKVYEVAAIKNRSSSSVRPVRASKNSSKSNSTADNTAGPMVDIVA